jgi:hypothetical protein
MADMDDYEYVSDGSYEFENAEGTASESEDDMVTRSLLSANKAVEPMDSQIVSAITATTASVLGECLARGDPVQFSWCFVTEPTLYFTIGSIRCHLLFANVTADSYKNAKVVFSDTSSAVNQVAFGSLLDRILKAGEAINAKDAAAILRDAFHIMQTESVGVTDSNKVQYVGPDADVQTFLKALAPMVPPTRGFTNGITRLLHLIIYAYHNLASHCYICGRVHRHIRGDDASPRTCNNELCRFVLQTSPNMCDLYTAIREPHASFRFDFGLAMLTAATRIPSRAEALLTPIHHAFVQPGGKIDVPGLSSALIALAAFDISVARDMETNREILEYCNTLSTSSAACLVYWIMNIVTDRCTIKGVDKTREECERPALILEWHDSPEHAAAYMAHAQSLPSSDVISAYHGSRIEHWYSILQHGLIVLSGTRHMTTGAAYGNGIYMSSNFQTSWGYCADMYGQKGKRFTCMAKSHILDKSPHLHKSGHYVIDNTAAFQIQELLVFTS